MTVRGIRCVILCRLNNIVIETFLICLNNNYLTSAGSLLLPYSFQLVRHLLGLEIFGNLILPEISRNIGYRLESGNRHMYFRLMSFFSV